MSKQGNYDDYLNINFFNIPDLINTDDGNNKTKINSQSESNYINNICDSNINISAGNEKDHSSQTYNFLNNANLITDCGSNEMNNNFNFLTKTGNEINLNLNENEFSVKDSDSDSEINDNDLKDNFIFYPIDYNNFKLQKIEDRNYAFNLDDYECPICLTIANNPIMCITCEKLICFNCVKDFKSKNISFRCPHCVEPFYEGTISRIVKNTLQNIPVICPNNPINFTKSNKYSEKNDFITEKGLETYIILDLENKDLLCKEFVIVDQFKTHLDTCNYTKRIGICKNCGETIHTTNKFTELKNHLIECSKSSTNCEFCLKSIPKLKIENHVNRCEQNIKQCKNCNAYLTLKELRKHTMKDCFLEMRSILVNIIKTFNSELKRNYDLLDTIHKIFKINEFNVNTMKKRELLLSFFEDFDQGEKIEVIEELGVLLSKDIANEANMNILNDRKMFEIDKTPFDLNDEIAKENNNDKINNNNLLNNSSDNTDKQNLSFYQKCSKFLVNNFNFLEDFIVSKFIQTKEGKIDLFPEICNIDETSHVVYFKDGTRYEGPILEGQAEGLGTRFYDYTDWDIMFKGSFKKNLFHGNGEIYSNNSLIAMGTFKEGLLSNQGLKIYSNGVTYEGNFKNGKEDGYGTITFNNKIKYKGDFKNGLKDGVGKYYFSRDSPYNSYQGQFKNDFIDGEGVLLYKDGSKYTGYFLNGKKNGTGKCQFTSASFYDGQWKNDKMSGFGTMKFSTGRKYIGNFFNDQWHGEGKEFNKNEKILFEGVYEYGKRKEGKLFERNDKVKIIKNFQIVEKL